jgi:hypothetical protein
MKCICLARYRRGYACLREKHERYFAKVSQSWAHDDHVRQIDPRVPSCSIIAAYIINDWPIGRYSSCLQPTRQPLKFQIAVNHWACIAISQRISDRPTPWFWYRFTRIFVDCQTVVKTQQKEWAHTATRQSKAKHTGISRRIHTFLFS